MQRQVKNAGSAHGINDGENGEDHDAPPPFNAATNSAVHAATSSVLISGVVIAPYRAKIATAARLSFTDSSLTAAFRFVLATSDSKLVLL
jgi:hypothetical protein